MREESKKEGKRTYKYFFSYANKIAQLLQVRTQLVPLYPFVRCVNILHRYICLNAISIFLSISFSPLLRTSIFRLFKGSRTQ